MKIVCARNEDEVREWARKQLLPRSQYVYASSPARLVGMRMRTRDVVRLEGFRDHPKRREINDVISRNIAKTAG